MAPLFQKAAEDRFVNLLARSGICRLSIGHVDFPCSMRHGRSCLRRQRAVHRGLMFILAASLSRAFAAGIRSGQGEIDLICSRFAHLSARAKTMWPLGGPRLTTLTRKEYANRPQSTPDLLIWGLRLTRRRSALPLQMPPRGRPVSRFMPVLSALTWAGISCKSWRSSARGRRTKSDDQFRTDYPAGPDEVLS